MQTNAQRSVNGNIINVPLDYPSIQQAVDAANPGDLVQVDTGTYYENVIFNQHGITVASRFFNEQNPEFIDKTIIDGMGNGPAVTITFGEQLSGDLIGFTITNGSGDIDGKGGGILIRNAKVHLGHLIIKDNVALQGGGIFCFGISEVDMFDVQIENNVAEKSGGGMRTFNTKFIMDNCSFINNSVTDGKGGAIYDRFSTNSGETVESEIRSTEFMGNTASQSTGGVYIDMSENAVATLELEIKGCVFDGNTASSNAALRISGSEVDVRILNSIFRNNVATTYVGGCGFNSNCTGGVYNTLFYDNKAANGGGDGNGAGASLFGNAEIDFYNCVFTGNTAPTGAGLTVGAGGRSILMNCIFRDNTNNPIHLADFNEKGGELEIYHSDMEYGENAISVSPLSSLIYGEGNIDEDPGFVGTGDHPFDISAGSPCIDAGGPVDQGMEIPDGDIMDNIRVWDGGSGSAVIDMGAYEYGSHPIGIDDYGQPGNIKVWCYPNPFTKTATITYELKTRAEVRLAIYDLLGKEISTVFEGKQGKGKHSLIWDASGNSEGIYFYRLELLDHFKSGKLVFVE